jgi:hypothetical protein
MNGSSIWMPGGQWAHWMPALGFPCRPAPQGRGPCHGAVRRQFRPPLSLRSSRARAASTLSPHPARRRARAPAGPGPGKEEDSEEVLGPPAGAARAALSEGRVGSAPASLRLGLAGGRAPFRVRGAAGAPDSDGRLRLTAARARPRDRTRTGASQSIRSGRRPTAAVNGGGADPPHSQRTGIHWGQTPPIHSALASTGGRPQWKRRLPTGGQLAE